MKTDGNEPANPTIGWEEIGDHGEKVSTTDCPGITKREYFAALIMQGLMANPNPGAIDRAAQMSVEGADMLISELNKPAV